MVTPAQLAANIANAQFSTGPVTTEDGASSSSNAIKLGFYANQAVLLTPEDHQAFDALVTAFRFELHPAGPIERAFYSQIVLAAWNIERTHRLEAGLASDGIDPMLSEANAKTLARIATYRIRSERTFHRCLKDFQAYQAAHPLDENPIVQNEAKVVSTVTPTKPVVREFAFKRVPYVRSEPKVGRNEICPCHSGRKYKHCCLQNEPNAVSKAAS